MMVDWTCDCPPDPAGARQHFCTPETRRYLAEEPAPLRPGRRSPPDAARDDVPRFDRRDPVVEAVRADLLARSTLGIAKYGATLDTLMPADALRHAYEETLDLANYLKRMLMNVTGQP